MTTPARPLVCLVTDRRRLRTDDDLVRLVAAAAAATVDFVQVREHQLGGRALYDLTRRLLSVIHGSRTRLLVNDRLDVALAAGAHGVHLRAGSFEAERVRRVTPTGFLIGRSVHSVEEAIAAGDVDYLVMGTVFSTCSKPADLVPAGVPALEAVCRAVDVPVLAIGGIRADRAGTLAAAGAAGIAAIGLFSDVLDGTAQESLEDGLRAILAQVRQGFELVSLLVAPILYFVSAQGYPLLSTPL